MKIAGLQVEVDERYRRLGLPSWPDPHPGAARPDEDEYSRVTDGERYRIVHARVKVWADVLAELDGVQVEALPPEELAGPGGEVFDRGVRITSPRPGTLPLILLEQSTHAEPDPEAIAVTAVAVAHSGLTLARQPDCGCDACDDGSEAMLRDLDEAVVGVVAGPLVTLTGDGWRVVCHPRGGTASSAPGVEMKHDVFVLAQRLAYGERVELPPEVEAHVGRSWLG